MITSQTSSSSLNSVSSLTNEISSGYPEKFKECCVIARKVYIDHRENKKSLTVIVTSHCELIECIENEVSNYINFNHEVTSIENNEFITSDNVDFDVMTLISDIVVYVVRIKSVLLTIKRKSSQLKILKVFSNVDSFNIKYNKNENSAAIFVTFHDKSQRKINPHCDDLDDLNCIKSEKFMKMIQYATGKSKKARFLLESISKDIEELHSMSTKHLPRVLLSEDPNDKTPLVRYGSIWTRILNEKLIIGIPVLCVSKSGQSLLRSTENISFLLTIVESKKEAIYMF